MQNETLDASLGDLLEGVTLIALDWNGTTVNDLDRAMRATNVVLARRGLPIQDLATFRETFKLPMTSYFGDLGIVPDDIAAAGHDWNTASTGEHADLSAGIVELLAAAATRQIPVGIISAASAEVVLTDARRLGIADQLAFVHGDAASKSTVLRELAAVHGGRIVYCGDTEYDVTEALNAGAVAIGFSGGYRPGAALVEAGAVCVVDSFAMLAEALLATD